jgi:hypothetical protein
MRLSREKDSKESSSMREQLVGLLPFPHDHNHTILTSYLEQELSDMPDVPELVRGRVQIIRGPTCKLLVNIAVSNTH